MVWLLPAALAGLLATLAPVVVHLLRRQRARTLVVPTVRFIPAVDQSVVRLRTPTDVPLLLVRVAIIACAALALARPLLLTDARAAGWAERIARVVVVDSGDPDATSLFRDAVTGELQSAAFARRIDSPSLAAGLRRAAAWLATAPPARREIVVVSGFRRGTLSEADLSDVPGHIGVRLVAIRADSPASVRVDAGAVLGGRGVLDRQARIDTASTAAIFSLQSPQASGLQLLTAPEDARDAETLLRIIARAGAHAPSTEQPIVVRFTGGAALPSVRKQPADSWTSGAALRLLRRADASGFPVRVFTGEAGALLVEVDTAPGTLVAAEVLKTVLDARPDPQHLERQEVAHVPLERLAGWSRPPAPADTTAWQQSDQSDARWVWLAALVLLGIEGWMRRRLASSATTREVDARAA